MYVLTSFTLNPSSSIHHVLKITSFASIYSNCLLFLLRISVDYLLFIVADAKLNPNPDEVSNVKYVNRDQLRELLRKADVGEDGIKLSPWFKLVADNFLFEWWNHVEKGTLLQAADMKTIHKL